ncbi:MAG: hypothetical protein J0M13_20130 [Candidatus Accumulibacter sp.]|nr:hypothetical protein [Candidatus Accumulibacter necessarius]
MSKKDVQWWKWDTALLIDGRVPEGARVILQRRPPVGAASGKMNLTLLYRELRVYGIDLDDSGPHSNTGMGRPYWHKMIETPALEHIWSEEGYGYAEPLDHASDAPAEYFRRFCIKTNLTLEGGFKPPPSQQLTLGLI